MRRTTITCTTAAALLSVGAAASAQSLARPDPVLQAIWQQGMEQSQVMDIAQTMMDSIGPRLTGTPQFNAGVDWAVKQLQSWGIEARAEQYGTWNGWRRGITHIDLLQPRLRSLEGMMLAWSPGTGGRPVQAEVVAIPEFQSEAQYQQWLGTVRGKIVAAAFPQPTCRPIDHYETYGMSLGRGGRGGRGGGRGGRGNIDDMTADQLRDMLRAQQAPTNAAERLQQERAAAQQRFSANRPGGNGLRNALENAGAAAILESNWSNDLGVNKVFSTSTQRTPTIDLSCEDYGLVYRLAANGQGPVVRIVAESEDLGEVPVHNVVGMIRGTELPNEYVMFSAHYDSWDGGSGATDNGTGSSMMLEAMRILKQTYPNPKRTIVIGLWGGEEQGLNGSRRFVGMHPEIVEGMQALFNQDNGTGRVVGIGMQGLVNAGPAFASWLSRMPSEITQHIELGNYPGNPGSGGSDYASFICAGAPAFGLSALSWDYGTSTWHTNRDTFDKIVEEDLRNNATLAAMLAYLASEHPEKLSRERRQGNWPQCQPGAATSPRAGGR